jgi:F-type H+-transporting ATPase subunit b
MNINLTLIGQSIVFIFFVWFTLKFVWPPIANALEERKKEIADGLAAGEKGKNDLKLAEKRVVEVIKGGKDKAAEIIGNADRHATEIVDGAKERAKQEAEKIIEAAQAEIEQEANQAREALRRQVSEIVVAATGKVLEKEIDAKAHARLIDGVVKGL